MNILAKSGTSARPFHFFKENYIMDKKEDKLEYRPLNKGMPGFVAHTENIRLKKVIEEKNRCISEFKKYDEERKAYYQDIQNLVDRLTDEKKVLQEEKANLLKTIENLRKKQEPLFAPELRKLMECGDLTATEYEKFMKLYAYWLQHRNDVMFYKSRLKQGRSSVKDLRKDLKGINEILLMAGNMKLLDKLSQKMLAMTAHLDTLQSRLSSADDEEDEDPEKG